MGDRKEVLLVIIVISIIGSLSFGLQNSAYAGEDPDPGPGDADVILTKRGDAVVLPGDQPRYFFDVANTGETKLFDCVITDQPLGIVIMVGDIDQGASVLGLGPELGPPMAADVQNTASVECFDGEGQPVNDTDSHTVFIFPDGVTIDKVCPAVVILPFDTTIDCTITVASIPTSGLLTDCMITDTISGPVAGPFDLEEGGDTAGPFNTSTPITGEDVFNGSVENVATVTCDTLDFEITTVSDMDTETIFIQSVDGTVTKNCEPDAQSEPGSIQWSWEVTNTSPDETSGLVVSCEGFSTLSGDDPEDNDILLIPMPFASQATNMWTESGLAAGTYENEIICTFTAQDQNSFQRMASDSCEVTPFEEPEFECTIEPTSANVEISEEGGSGFVEKKITCNLEIDEIDSVSDNCSNYNVSFLNPQLTSFNMLEFTEQVTNTGPLEPENCEVTFKVEPALNLPHEFVTQELRINMPENKKIGGTSIPISTTSLLVAGFQANMGLWSLALVGIVGAGAAITYKIKSKKTEK